VDPDPITRFRSWLEEIRRQGAIRYPHAATLATYTLDGRIDARTILVLEVDAAGFHFLTDSRTEKARVAESGSPAALVFYWEPPGRQVRVRGDLARAPDDLADRLFEERPRSSRVTAWVCRQGEPVSSRSELEARHRAAESRRAGDEVVPRPLHWRAYSVVPRAIEFFTARRHRLHDRLRFERTGDGRWRGEILEP